MVLELHPFLFVSNLAPFGTSFVHFWALRGYFFCSLGLFLGLASGSKTFLEPTYVVSKLWSWKFSPMFLFLIRPNCGPFFHFFWAIFWSFGAIFGVGVRFKTFLEPTYVVNQLWFWKYSPIFLLLLRPNLGPFLPFLGLWGLFLGLRSGSKTFLGPTYID